MRAPPQKPHLWVDESLKPTSRPIPLNCAGSQSVEDRNSTVGTRCGFFGNGLGTFEMVRILKAKIGSYEISWAMWCLWSPGYCWGYTAMILITLWLNGSLVRWYPSILSIPKTLICPITLNSVWYTVTLPFPTPIGLTTPNVSCQTRTFHLIMPLLISAPDIQGTTLLSTFPCLPYRLIVDVSILSKSETEPRGKLTDCNFCRSFRT